MGLHYGRIMVSIILNREVAFTACGLWAGNRKISPSPKVGGLPAMITSPRPSMPWTKASKGEVCSLKPCPSSNAKTVTLPLSHFRITRLTTVSVLIADRAQQSKNLRFGNL